MNREDLKEVLAHREPMLLVDEAFMNEDGTVTGRYTVRGDEFFLQGHFPGNPIVPGVMLCEMASQSSALLVAEKVKGKVTLFAGMNNVKFKTPVTVGDTVEFTCAVIRAIGLFHFTIDLMRENRVGDLMERDCHWPQLAGYGYGFGVRTLISRGAGGSLSSLGEFGWDGAKGVYVLIDPSRRLSVTYAEHRGGDKELVQPRLRDLTYACLDLG